MWKRNFPSRIIVHFLCLTNSRLLTASFSVRVIRKRVQTSPESVFCVNTSAEQCKIAWRNCHIQCSDTIESAFKGVFQTLVPITCWDCFETVHWTREGESALSSLDTSQTYKTDVLKEVKVTDRRCSISWDRTAISAICVLNSKVLVIWMHKKSQGNNLDKPKIFTRPSLPHPQMGTRIKQVLGDIKFCRRLD